MNKTTFEILGKFAQVAKPYRDAKGHQAVYGIVTPVETVTTAADGSETPAVDYIITMLGGMAKGTMLAKIFGRGFSFSMFRENSKPVVDLWQAKIEKFAAAAKLEKFYGAVYGECDDYVPSCFLIDNAIAMIETAAKLEYLTGEIMTVERLNKPYDETAAAVTKPQELTDDETAAAAALQALIASKALAAQPAAAQPAAAEKPSKK